MPTYTQYTEDPVLTAIAVAYHNPDATLIADEVLPRVKVGGLKFGYQTYNEADSFTVPDTRIGRRSSPNMVEIDGQDATGECADYGIGVPLDNDTIAEAERKGFDPRKQATERATNIVLLDREIRVRDVVFNAASYNAANKIQLAGTSQFSDFVNSDPIGQITDMLDGCFMRPNKLVFGQRSWSITRRHPDILKAINHNSGDKGMASRQAMADLFEVDQVLVGASRVNLAKPGQPVGIARVWGSHIAGVFIDRTVNTGGGVTFGFTAQYGDRVAGTKDLDIGLRGGISVRAGETVKELAIANRAGCFIQDAVL